MTSPDRSGTDHGTHDLLLVAALAAGDVDARDRSRAALQVAGCAACAELRDDLVAIAAATGRLPAPRRRREFTLSREDAARLHRPSLRRILVELAGPRGLIGRPLATAVTSLGLAGIVLASAGGMLGGFGFLGAAGAAPAASAAPQPATEYGPGESWSLDGTSAPVHVTGSESGAPLGPLFGGSSGDTSGIDGLASEPPDIRGQAGGPTPAASPDRLDLKSQRDAELASRPSPLVPVSLGLIGLGLALFVLRRIAARLA